MKWTMGLLLIAAAGCGGYRQTRMVACPDTGCGHQYAARVSPQGLPAPREPSQPPEYRPIYRAEPVAAPAPLPPPAEMPPEEAPPPLPPPAP